MRKGKERKASSHCRCGVARFVGNINQSLLAAARNGGSKLGARFGLGQCKMGARPSRPPPKRGQRERTAKRRKTRIRNEMRKEKRNLRQNPVG